MTCCSKVSAAFGENGRQESGGEDALMKDYIAKRDLTDFDIVLMTIARYEVHSPFSVS